MTTKIIAEFDVRDREHIAELESQLLLLEEYWHLQDPRTGEVKSRFHARVAYGGHIENRQIIDITPIKDEAVICPSRFSSRGKNGDIAHLCIGYSGTYQEITINNQVTYRIHFKEPRDELEERYKVLKEQYTALQRNVECGGDLEVPL